MPSSEIIIIEDAYASPEIIIIIEDAYASPEIIIIISYLFGFIVVNLSCNISHYYTVQEEQF